MLEVLQAFQKTSWCINILWFIFIVTAVVGLAFTLSSVHCILKDLRKKDPSIVRTIKIDLLFTIPFLFVAILAGWCLFGLGLAVGVIAGPFFLMLFFGFCLHMAEPFEIEEENQNRLNTPR